VWGFAVFVGGLLVLVKQDEPYAVYLAL
jgi:hypothetical protein